MISTAFKRTLAVLEKSRVVIPVFGTVVRGHVWTVHRLSEAPPGAFSSNRDLRCFYSWKWQLTRQLYFTFTLLSQPKNGFLIFRTMISYV